MNYIRPQRLSGLDLFTDFPFADLDSQRSFVKHAELAGYTGVLATENHHDPFLPIAAAANRNSQITVGTAVVTILAHNPFSIAQMAWDLHYNTNEQFILGICTHQDVHLTHRLGISSEHKHQRLVEAVETIREIWAAWMDDRDPYFVGKYYSIHVCPPGYRPITKVQSFPKIYLLCSTEMDLKVASKVAEGIFTHPTWNRQYIDQMVLPQLKSSSSETSNQLFRTDLKIIDGSVIATGENNPQLEESRYWARKRIGGYWLQAKYDDVFDALGLRESIQRFRFETDSEKVNWEKPYIKDLYETFVCDALYEDLASRLFEHHSEYVTGVFPNIMSSIPRLLPSYLVSEIRSPVCIS